MTGVRAEKADTINPVIVADAVTNTTTNAPGAKTTAYVSVPVPLLLDNVFAVIAPVVIERK
jgi:hypothetical protein